jgi:hypothetical protein
LLTIAHCHSSEQFCGSKTVEVTATEIYVMNADGTGVGRLTRNRVADSFAAWQPVVEP